MDIEGKCVSKKKWDLSARMREREFKRFMSKGNEESEFH